MALSSDLLKSFAKITNDTPSGNEPSFIFGTAKKVGNDYFVKFDGSTIYTPVDSTVDISDDDRVMVMIQNHNCIVTSNASSPAVNGDHLTEFSGIIDATYVKTAYLEANYITADTIETDYLKTANLNAAVGNLGYLNAAKADIAYARLDKANIGTGWVKQAMIDEGAVGTAQIKNGSITSAKINELSANVIKGGKIDAKDVTITNLNADNITVGTINGQRIATGAIDHDKLSKTLSDMVDGSVADVAIYYGLSTSTTVPPAATDWSKEAPPWEDGKYMWQKTVQVLTDGTEKPTDVTCIAGATGKTGPRGKDGEGMAGLNRALGTATPWTETVTINQARHTYSYATYELDVPVNDMGLTSDDYLNLSFDYECINFTNSMYIIPKISEVRTTASGSQTILEQINFHSGTITANREVLDSSYSNVLDNSGSKIVDSYSSHYSGHYSAKAKFVSYSVLTANRVTFEIGCYDDVTGSTEITISNLKLESGETDTPWCIAYSDLTEAADNARKTADGKNTVFYQSREPSGSDHSVNDIWFDTENDNAMHYWNGSAWIKKELGTDAIAAESIMAHHIVAGAVTAAAIEAGSITAGKLAVDAVTAGAIAAEAIHTEHLSSNIITADHLMTDSVTSDAILAGSITGAKLNVADILANSAIITEIFAHDITATGTITGAELISGLLRSSNYTPGTLPYSADGMKVDLLTRSIETPNFAVDNDGNVYAKSGVLGGWTIDSGSMRADSGDYKLHIVSDPNNQDFLVVAHHPDQSETAIDWPFWVHKDGTMHAEKGSIGGWTINSDSLYSNCGASEIWIRDGSPNIAGNRDVLVVRTGGEENWSYPFWLRADGTMHAEYGDIAGWNFTINGFEKNGNAIRPSGTIELTYNGAAYTWAIGVSQGADGSVEEAGNGLVFSTINKSTGAFSALLAFYADGAMWTNGRIGFSRKAGSWLNAFQGNSSIWIPSAAASDTFTAVSCVKSSVGRWITGTYNNDHSYRIAYALDSTVDNGMNKTDATYVFGPTGTFTCVKVTQTSDIRLKENVKDTDVNALADISKMLIRQFDWKTDGEHVDIGFIADELEKVNNSLVVGGGYDNNGEMITKSIDTMKLLSYAIKAIQELNSKVKELERRTYE